MSGINKTPKYFVFFLIAIHAVYFVLACIFKNIVYTDSIEYIRQAENIWEHFSVYAGDYSMVPHDNYLYTIRQPVYALFILPFLLVFKSYYAVILAQNILSIFCFTLLRKIILLLKPESKPEKIIMLSLVLFPIHFFFVNMIMSEIVFVFLLIAAFNFLVKHRETKEVKFFFLFCLMLTISLFTKAVLLYFSVLVFALGIWYFFVAHRSKYFGIREIVQKKWLYIFASLLMPLSIVVQSKINESITGYYHFNSIQVYNRLNHNVKEYLAIKNSYEYADHVCDSIWFGSMEIRDMKSQYQYVSRFSDSVIKNNPVSYGFYHIKGMIPVMLAPGRNEFKYFFGIPDTHENNVMLLREISTNGISGLQNYLKHTQFWEMLTTVFLGIWNLFLLLSLVYFFFIKNIYWLYRYFIVFIIGYIALASSLTVGASRFRMPFYPLLVISAVVTVNDIKEKRRNLQF